MNLTPDAMRDYADAIKASYPTPDRPVAFDSPADALTYQIGVTDWFIDDVRRRAVRDIAYLIDHLTRSAQDLLKRDAYADRPFNGGLPRDVQREVDEYLILFRQREGMQAQLDRLTGAVTEANMEMYRQRANLRSERRDDSTRYVYGELPTIDTPICLGVIGQPHKYGRDTRYPLTPMDLRTGELTRETGKYASTIKSAEDVLWNAAYRNLIAMRQQAEKESV